MKALHGVAFVLVIIGGLNWLLIGLFNWGVADIIGNGIAQIVYILVGLSAVYIAVTHKKTCRNCETSSTAPMSSM